MTPEAPLLAIQNLAVKYGPIAAVKDISFEIGKGEIVALLGPNGAGKTSTLNAISGLIESQATSITFQGVDIRRDRVESRVRKGIALSPEGRQIFGELTVAENLRLGGATRSRSERDASYSNVYELFPILWERKDQYAGTLSGGQQQQLAIGRALMSAPQVLLLDEPSLGLAPRIVDVIFDLIALLRDRGVTILIVEQNVSRTLEIADRGYVLEGGKVVLSGTSSELQSADADLVGAFLGIGGGK